MPERYHIATEHASARFPKPGKFGIVDWREDCARCRNCVKNACISGIYTSEYAYDRDPGTPVEPFFDCRACLSCVQNCTKGLLSLSINPAFLALGNQYWSKEMIQTTWAQAETGKIPVSGSGYRGPFCGPGFDSMWTDMSEIVRPTRDGIHGREYISTYVDIGSKPLYLRFGPDGRLDGAPPIVEVPLPLILDIPPWGPDVENLAKARMQAATRLQTFAVVSVRNARLATAESLPYVAPLFTGDDFDESLLNQVRFVEIADGPQAAEKCRRALAVNPKLVVAVRALLGSDTPQRLVQLHREGVRVVHICADTWGQEINVLPGIEARHIRDALRDLHGSLVAEGVRDEMTLIIGGGIALAEHMAKGIICGADLVAVDAPLMVAIGCRVCDGDHDGSCPIAIKEVEVDYAAQRMVNLMGAWHLQLIEVLGAMGIREVRRLRGETGRAMFLEDLDREAFGDIGY